MAEGHPPRRPRRPRLQPQVEHGLDARHARLLRARPGAPPLPPPRPHLRPAVRLHRELRAAAVATTRSCTARVAARQDAGRRVAALRQPARAVRAGCGPIPAASCCSWAARSRRGGSGTRTPGCRLAPARRRAPPRRAGAGRGRSTGVGRRVAGAVGARPRAGRVPVARRRRRRPLHLRLPALVGRRSPASWPASPTSRRCPATGYRVGLPWGGEWEVLLDTDATWFGGTGFGGVPQRVGRRRRARSRASRRRPSSPAAPRRALARRRRPLDCATPRRLGAVVVASHHRSASPSASSACLRRAGGGQPGCRVAKTCALSLLVFTGASQFAAVGVVGAGGRPGGRARPARCCWPPATAPTGWCWPRHLRGPLVAPARSPPSS